MSQLTRSAALGLALAVFVALPAQSVVLPAQSASAQEGDRADLALTKIANRKEVRRDQNIVFVATVTNLGPDTSRDITFRDSLPDQLNGIDAACVFPDGAIVPTPRPEGIPSFACDVDALENGESASLVYVAQPISNITKAERRIRNTAFIAEAATEDPRESNNSDSVTVKFIFE
jgi:uncharacterized repeat protein (TIGR01451 family)